MASVTLTTLRARVRERADLTGSLFVTDAATSLDAFINASLQELYDLVIQKYGGDYFVSSSSGNTSAGVSTVNLPSGFYKLLGVDFTISGSPVSLKPFSFSERNAFKNGNTGSITVPRYRLEGSTLRFYPAPASATAYVIWYIPEMTALSGASDAVNYPGGWEEYAVLDAAIKCREKQQQDVSALMAAKDRMVRRIEEAAQSRDAAEPPKMTDIHQAWVGFDPWGP